MNILLDSMIDNVIRKYGHESPEAIEFCTVAEGEGPETISELYTVLMKEGDLNE